MATEFASMSSDHALQNSNDQHINLNTFRDKREYEASKNLVETRSDKQKPFKKLKEINSVWDVEPVDFSLKLYHPKPLKRNSREAIKPWTYDKYLKKPNVEIINEDSNNSAEKVVLNNLISSSENNEMVEDFQGSFRVLTPNEARIEASKHMGFRNGLEQFKNPQPFNHRGRKNLYGLPDFKTRFEKDPFNTKFLTSNLDQIHGLYGNIGLRYEDPGLQMGDLVKKAEPHYDPELILPRLSFPNEFKGYTRYRRRDRSVEGAFWDRVLPKLNEDKTKQLSGSVKSLIGNFSN